MEISEINWLKIELTLDRLRRKIKKSWFHSAAGREVGQPESLHELVDVDAAVLVEVDAGRQVCYGLVADVHLEVGAEELPGLTKLLVGDRPLMEEGR